MDVWRINGDHTLFSGGSCIPQETSVYLPSGKCHDLHQVSYMCTPAALNRVVSYVLPETHVVLPKSGWMITSSTTMQQDLQLRENHMESEFVT